MDTILEGCRHRNRERRTGFEYSYPPDFAATPSSLCIFEGVGHEVKQDLTDSGRIGEENRRNRIIGVVTEADTRSERFGRPEIRDGLQNITEVEVDILQLQPYPEHRSEAF